MWFRLSYKNPLANDDSSYNKVERKQSCKGDAICDGGSLEWEYQGQSGVLKEHKMQKITFEKCQRHVLEQMEFNSFKVRDNSPVE